MKNELRKKSLEKRKTLDCKNLSNQIMKHLFSLEEYQKSKNILCYFPLKYEVDTHLCLEDKTKNIYLPRVNGENLEICPCKDLKKGSFGIIEPFCESITDYSYINLVIIPACAADKHGFRLGYGKGYYDRFLPKLKKECIKVILVYSSLLYETVNPAEYDVQADIIVTDKEILRIKCKKQ